MGKSSGGQSGKIKLPFQDKIPTAGKVVYLVVSAASKARAVPELVEKLQKLGVIIYIIPTPNAAPLLAGLGLQPSPHVYFVDGEKTLSFASGAAQPTAQLEKEDVVVVAPCTFNSLNKIAAGITDNYALTVVANAIANKTPVIVAPSYDTLWHHPKNLESIETLRSWRAQVIYPDLEADHITMVSVDKIVDSVHSSISKVKFSAYLLDDVMHAHIHQAAIREYLPAFRKVGEAAARDGLNSSIHGCMSVRIDARWMLITATGTSLENLSEDDVTLVEISRSYNTKTIHWFGKKMPSSESPLHISAYMSRPETDAVLHSHCPGITYNPKLGHLKTALYVPYGDFNVINHLDAILRANDGFGIMRLHGEVVCATSLDDAYAKLRRYLTVETSD